MKKYCRCTAERKLHPDGSWVCIHKCPPLASLKPKKKPRPPEPLQEKGFRIEQRFTEAARKLGLVGGRWGAALPSGMVRNTVARRAEKARR